MNYIMGLPRFGIQKSRHTKDIRGTCKTTQENVPRSNKRNTHGDSDRKKKKHFTEHTIRSQYEKKALKEGNLCSSACPTIKFLRNRS
jgi:hypothetical protein